MTAAANLLGLTLQGGWTVIEFLQRPANGSGGTFSHSYLAQRDQDVAFVKAFDFSSAFAPGEDTVRVLAQLTASFEHERETLEHCRGRRLSHVAVAIDHGHVDVPGMNLMEGRVYYLLFEKAEGDIRCQMDASDSFDSVWCVRTLRQVCLGLWQIHREWIAHQDVKPSNVLYYPVDEIRIADFGRSSRRRRAVWHDDFEIAGDRSYAPLELLYGHLDPDFIRRRIGTDVYMLGNLAVFLFTGVNLTELVIAKLHVQHHPNNWRGDYHAVLPYLKEAFGRALEDVAAGISQELHPKLLPLVKQLGSPDLSQRGNPRLVGRPDQFSLEPYVSRLTNMVGEVQVMARTGRLRV